MESQDYISVYKCLFDILNDDTPHNSKTSGKQIGKTHIKYAALIFLNFLLEYDMFKVIYFDNNYNVYGMDEQNNYLAVYRKISKYS